MTCDKCNIRYQVVGLGTYSRNLQHIRSLKFRKYVKVFWWWGTELLFRVILTTLCQLLVYIASMIDEWNGAEYWWNNNDKENEVLAEKLS